MFQQLTRSKPQDTRVDSVLLLPQKQNRQIEQAMLNLACHNLNHSFHEVWLHEAGAQALKSLLSRALNNVLNSRRFSDSLNVSLAQLSRHVIKRLIDNARILDARIRQLLLNHILHNLNPNNGWRNWHTQRVVGFAQTLQHSFI